MSTGRYAFNAADDGVDIEILDEIDDWWGYGVRQLSYDLSNAGDRAIRVKVHSPGGLFTEGMGIRNLLRGRGNVSTSGVGLVASIATAILLSGDKGKVSMSDNAMFMIHEAWAGMIGGAEDMEAASAFLRKLNGQLADMYLAAIRERGKLVNGSEEDTRAQIVSWMAAETWFTAQEALDAGFIDEVTDGVEFITTDNAQAYLTVFNSFNNAPESLITICKSKLGEMAGPKKKKGWFAAFREAINSLPELEETAEETAETEESLSDEELQELINTLEEAGYEVAPAEANNEETGEGETGEGETGEEEEEVNEEEEEEVTADAIASLLREGFEAFSRQQSGQAPQGTRRRGGPSSGGKPQGKPGEGDGTGNAELDKIKVPYNKARSKQYSGFAKFLMEKAKLG